MCSLVRHSQKCFTLAACPTPYGPCPEIMSVAGSRPQVWQWEVYGDIRAWLESLPAVSLLDAGLSEREEKGKGGRG